MTIKVLIVDPEIGFAVPIKRALELSGDYRVNVFASGKAAVEALHRERHDVAILDFNVADLKLPELIKAVRRVQADLFVLVSPASDEHIALIPSLDVQGSMTKPYLARQLVPVIREAVNAKAQLASNQSEAGNSPAEPEAPPRSTIVSEEPAMRPDDTFVRLVKLFGGDVENLIATPPFSQQSVEEPEIPEGATIRDMVSGTTPPRPAAPAAPDTLPEPDGDTPPPLAVLALEAAEDDTISLTRITPPNLIVGAEQDLDDTAAALSNWLQQIVAAEQGGAQPINEIERPNIEPVIEPPSASEQSSQPAQPSEVVKKPDSDFAEELFGTLLGSDQEEKPSKRRPTGSLHELLGKLIDEDASASDESAQPKIRAKTGLFDKIIDAIPQDAARDAEKKLEGLAQEQNLQASQPVQPEQPPAPSPSTEAVVPVPVEVKTATETPSAQPTEAAVPEAQSDAKSETKPDVQPETPTDAQPAEPAKDEESPVASLALHLTQLTVGSTAEATLVTRGNEVIASAGQIPQRTLATVLETINAAWQEEPEEQRNALVRYLHVTGAGDYLLYSTPTSEGMALSMLFPAETPLKVIRRHAKELITALEQVPEMPAREGSTSDSPPQIVESEAATTLMSRPTDLRPPEGLREAIAAGEATSSEPEVPQRGELPYAGYSFAWLPRINILPGEVAGVLLDWIHAIAKTHLWDLDGVEIQPGYVTVQVSIPANETPTATVEALMHETAERAGDFALWADAYYIVSPNRAITQQEIAAFVEYYRDAETVT